MQTRHIMTPNPSVVTKQESVARAAALMRDRHVGMLPVIDDLRTRRLVGVLTDRDIIVRGVAGGRNVDRPVGDVMTADSLAVARVDMSPDQVVRLMRRQHVRRLPVLDERERLVGVISFTDLSRRVRDPRSYGIRAATRDDRPSAASA